MNLRETTNQRNKCLIFMVLQERIELSTSPLPTKRLPANLLNYGQESTPQTRAVSCLSKDQAYDQAH
jgi:hypothetical protein